MLPVAISAETNDKVLREMATDIHLVSCDLKTIEEVALDHRCRDMRSCPADNHDQRTGKQVFCLLDGRHPRNDD
jgi:hypothetical protein